MIINDADVILYLFYILIGRWNKNDYKRKSTENA